jgi:hypothetical protein
MHLPLLHSGVGPVSMSPAQARGVSQARRTTTGAINGEAFMLAMPAEPPSGVWDVEVHLQCGREKPYDLPLLGGLNFKFREGLDEEEQLDFVQAVLPSLSTALQLASEWKFSENGKVVMKDYNRASGIKVLGMVAAMFAWLAFMIITLMGATLDPPIPPTACFGLGAGVAVLAVILTVVTNIYSRRVAKLSDEWLVEASQKLHDDLVHGRAASQLFRAGFFVARGDPDWRPTKLCCNRVSREHIAAAYPGPIIKVAQLQSNEIVAVPIVSRMGRPHTRQAQADSEPVFEDDPGMNSTRITAPSHGVAVNSADIHVEDPFNREDDPAM